MRHNMRHSMPLAKNPMGQKIVRYWQNLRIWSDKIQISTGWQHWAAAALQLA
jgi:hypothetical protein